MPKATNVIPTRQLTENLFSASAPAPGGGSIVSGVRKVEGFDMVTVFVVADTPVEVRIEEGCSGDGLFVRTKTFASVTAGSFQQICEFCFPCGSFFRATLVPTGAPPTVVSFCLIGVPVP